MSTPHQQQPIPTFTFKPILPLHESISTPTSELLTSTSKQFPKINNNSLNNSTSLLQKPTIYVTESQPSTAKDISFFKENITPTKQQVPPSLTDIFQSYDVTSSSTPIKQQRSDYKSALEQLRQRSSSLFSKAIDFVAVTQRNDEELDSEVQQQSKELIEFKETLRSVKQCSKSLMIPQAHLTKLLRRISKLEAEADDARSNRVQLSSARKHSNNSLRTSRAITSISPSYIHSPLQFLSPTKQFPLNTSQTFVAAMTTPRTTAPRTALEQQLRLSSINVHVYLVQNKTINSSIVSLLGHDRIIIGTPYKGSLQISSITRTLTHGDLYNFSSITLVRGKLIERIMAQIEQKKAAESHSINIFTIGTRSAGKKEIQIDLLHAIKQGIKQKLVLNFQLQIKVRYYQHHRGQEASGEQVITLMNNDDQRNDLDTVFTSLSELTNSTSGSRKTFTEKKNKKQQHLDVDAGLPHTVRAIKISCITFRRNFDGRTTTLQQICKQSYRICSSNRIIQPEKKSVKQILTESFSSEERSDSHRGTTSNMAGMISKSAANIFADENIVVFACAPMLKYQHATRVLFKSANLLEKYKRSALK